MTKHEDETKADNGDEAELVSSDLDAPVTAIVGLRDRLHVVEHGQAHRIEGPLRRNRAAAERDLELLRAGLAPRRTYRVPERAAEGLWERGKAIARAQNELFAAARAVAATWDWSHLLEDHPDSADVRKDVERLASALAALDEARGSR